MAVTTPFSTVATAVLLLVQITVLSVALSGLTVATKVASSPISIFSAVLSKVTPLTGITTGSGSFTVTLQVAILSPACAVITASPSAMAVTTPFSTVATALLLLVQITVLSVALSGLTVAVNVSLSPISSSSAVLSKVTPLTGISDTPGSSFT